METVFTRIYNSCDWGNNGCSQYRGGSGRGSTIEYNQDEYIPFLKSFIIENGIKSVVDLGCGDFACGPLSYDDLNIEYTGYDVYKLLVDYNTITYPNYNFIYDDFYENKENIVSGDLCIIKDVLEHWPSDYITILMDYLTTSKKFKYILICNCYNDNVSDIHLGEFRGLSCDIVPLSNYNLIKKLNYNSKEVSLFTSISETQT